MKKCQFCQKEMKTGLNFHERACKKNPVVIAKKEKSIPMKDLEPSPSFKPDMTQTEPERFKAFLDDAPIWSQYKPSAIQKILAQIFNRGISFISLVFVSENRPPRVAYLPYDPEKNRIIIPGKGYYETPISGGVGFFHEDYMLPLVNSPRLSDRFMLPAHVVLYAHAQGLAEGKAEGFDDLIRSINKWQTITMLVCILGALVLIASGYMVYQAAGNEEKLISLMNNVTEMSKNTKVVIGE